MGRKSIKEDKNVYHLRRDELNLSRAAAAQLLETISEDRICRIELKNLAPHPDEVVVMAEKYKCPSLRNYYCANQCPIGKRYSFEVKIGDLPTIVLQTIAALNTLEKQKDRFIEIAADCEVGESELSDFQSIQESLRKISISVEALRLWTEQAELARE